MKKVFFLLLLPIAIASLRAEENQVKQSTNPLTILDRLIELDGKLKSLKTNFSQEIYFKVADIKEKVEGEIIFKKPGDLKIIHKKPKQQTIIIKEKKEIIIIKPDDRQIIRSSWEKWKGTLEPKLKGIIEFGNYASLKYNSKIIMDENNKTIKLTPYDNSYTLTIKLNDNYFPAECELDLKDTLIKTYLTDTIIDPDIKKDEFEYKNEKKFDVLKL